MSAYLSPAFLADPASVDDWLVALKLERYSEAFAGVSLGELRELTDERLVELGVLHFGHPGDVFF